MRSEEETGQQEIRTKGRQGRREAGLEGEGDSKELKWRDMMKFISTYTVVENFFKSKKN